MAMQQSFVNRKNDGRVREPGVLAAPSLRFDLNDEIRRLESEPRWQAGHTARTIVKYDDFRVVLITISAGARLVEHRTAARISIQALTGKIRVRVGTDMIEVAAGGLLTLDRDLEHEVEALEHSAFLVTIAWPPAHAALKPALVRTEPLRHQHAEAAPEYRAAENCSCSGARI